MIEIAIEKAYVARGDAMRAVQEHFEEGGFDGYTDGQICMDRIKNIPAADVVKVRHGRWHDVYMSSASSFVGTCSVCGKSNDIPPVPLANYCPNCGAKMDGGQDE